MKGIMKLLVVLTGLLWMSVCTTGIPLEAVKKNLTKISDESAVVISDTKNAKDKDDGTVSAADAAKVIPELKSNVVDEKNETLNNGKTGIAKPIKSGKGKSKKLNVDPSKAIVGLRKKIKAVKRKLKAKLSYIDSDSTLLGQNKNSKKKPQNKTLDLSDIDDVLPDRLKKKYGDFVKNGRGKSVDELANIRKKLRILRKITGPRTHSSKNNDSDTTSAEGEGDSLLFQGDEELDDAQLDSIIASTARHYGVDIEPLKKFGVKSRPKRQAILAPNDTPVDRLWPKTLAIKYYYDDDITPNTRSIIEQAFTNLENQTCLWFKEDKDAVPRIQFVNYGDACASPVGYYKDNIHKIKIAKCLTNYGTISHEILHVLGIKHQQARYDRDDYLNDANGIEILDETNSDNFGSPYDYGSVMHYGRFDTTQKLYDQTIGHRVGPSFIDIAIVNQRYNCFCKNPTVTCLNGGYPNPNDCDSCICQHGYGSRTCGEIDPGTEEESEVINVESNECQTFEKSLGTDNDIRYNYYKKTWYHFKAPPGKKVQFIFLKGTDADLSESDGCDDNGIEVKITKSKFNRTGFVFCGNNKKFISDSNDNIITFNSTNNLGMLQLFTRKNKIDVIVKYRFVDSESDEIPSSCAPVNEGDCENIDTDVECEGWAADPDEDCEADPVYMLENCPKTCNSCPICENIQSDVKCEGWAANPDEDCEADPVYMSENCAKTCGIC